nr:hypothetical protein [Tanacetum cinerariifolium]
NCLDNCLGSGLDERSYLLASRLSPGLWAMLMASSKVRGLEAVTFPSMLRGASLGSRFLLALSALAMVAAYVSKAVATLSTTSCLMEA